MGVWVGETHTNDAIASLGTSHGWGQLARGPCGTHGDADDSKEGGGEQAICQFYMSLGGPIARMTRPWQSRRVEAHESGVHGAHPTLAVEE